MARRRAGRPRKNRVRGLKGPGDEHARRCYGPTAEQRAKRQALVGTGAAEHLAEYPLGVLFARGLIDSDQLDAGCRYARLFRLALGGESLAAVNLTGKVFDPPGEQDEAWLAARSRDYHTARCLLSRQGRRVRELVENVTVYQRLPAWVYRCRPPSAGDIKALDRLTSGLSDLALHFRGAYRRAA